MDKTTNTLTERQAAVLDFIRRSLEQHSYPPSRREIEEAAGISSAATGQVLEQLEEKGYIEFERNRARSIRLKGQAPVKKSLKVPIRGTISAGIPAAREPALRSGKSVEISSDMLPPSVHRSGLFALRVQGNGLVDASIQDGDLVILESDGTLKGAAPLRAAEGEIVAVRMPGDGQALLTRLYREKNGYKLQPANRDLEPVRVDQNQDLEIEGKVVAVIRSFKI